MRRRLLLANSQVGEYLPTEIVVTNNANEDNAKIFNYLNSLEVQGYSTETSDIKLEIYRSATAKTVRITVEGTSGYFDMSGDGALTQGGYGGQ